MIEGKKTVNNKRFSLDDWKSIAIRQAQQNEDEYRGPRS